MRLPASLRIAARARAATVLAAVATSILWSPARAGTTTTVVDVSTRGVTQRFLYVRPEAPIANIIFLPGSTGILGIENDGSMPTLPGRCAPFARNRDAFAARGFALALVDRSSDGKVRQYADVLEVVSYMHRRDAMPTWIVGGSASTLAALDFAARYPPDEPLGVIIFSPWGGEFSRAAAVKRPTLVVYHEQDRFSAPRIGPLYDALIAAPLKERVALDGGVGGEECGGHHLFMGIDAAFVNAVAGFIDRNGTLRH